MKSPFFILSEKKAKTLGKRLKSIAKVIKKLFPRVENDLKRVEEKDIDGYILNSFISSFSIASMIFIFSFFIRPKEQLIAQGLSFVIFFFIFTINMIYPKIKLKDKDESLNKYLVFLMRDLIIQIRSGVMLFDAVENTTKSTYGPISTEFKNIANQIKSGASEEEAFREVLLKSNNEFFKKMLWQISNAMQTGSKIQFVLFSLLHSLKEHMRKESEQYIKLVGMMTTFYLLLGIVLPLLGLIFSVIILSSFGTNIEKSLFILTIGFSGILQFFLVGYIKAARPPYLR